MLCLRVFLSHISYGKFSKFVWKAPYTFSIIYAKTVAYTRRKLHIMNRISASVPTSTTGFATKQCKQTRCDFKIHLNTDFTDRQKTRISTFWILACAKRVAKHNEMTFAKMGRKSNPKTSCFFSPSLWTWPHYWELTSRQFQYPILPQNPNATPKSEEPALIFIAK